MYDQIMSYRISHSHVLRENVIVTHKIIGLIGIAYNGSSCTSSIQLLERVLKKNHLLCGICQIYNGGPKVLAMHIQTRPSSAIVVRACKYAVRLLNNDPETVKGPALSVILP
jgi:hypothetical protein